MYVYKSPLLSPPSTSPPPDTPIPTQFFSRLSLTSHSTHKNIQLLILHNIYNRIIS